MSKNAIAFLAGLGTGYLNQSEKNKRQERQDKLDARDEEKYQFERAGRQKETDKTAAMAEAFAPTSTNVSVPTLDTSAGTVPDAAIAAAVPTQYSVNGVDAGSAPQMASAAKARLDTPEAGNQRAAVAMRGLGDYQGAMQLESASKQAQAADMELADKAWNRKIGQGMMSGHDGLAGVISNSEFGPMAGKKVVAVKSPDNSTVTYNMVNPDGSLTPSNLTFTNDQDGITKAGYMLNSAITQEHRYANWKDEKKTAQTQANADRTFGLQEKADVRAGNADARAERADGRAAASAATERKSPGIRKIEETEAILGRKLTQPERERLSGIGKDDDKADWTFATNVATEAVKAGTIAPDAAAGVRQATFNTISGGKQAEKIRAGISKAKSAGQMTEVVAELRARGMTDDAIISLGGDIPKTEAKEDPKKAPTPRGGTSGSHAIKGWQQPQAVGSANKAKSERLKEIEMRLALDGTSPEIILALTQEKNALLGKSKIGLGSSLTSLSK